MTEQLTIYLFDKESEQAKSLAFLENVEIHTWHPENAYNRGTPTLLVFPETHAVIIQHGGAFSKFASTIKHLMRLEGSELGTITNFNTGRTSLTDKLLKEVA